MKTDKRIILLIDDDQNIFFSLQMVFDGKAYKIVYADSCVSARKKIKAGLKFDLIIMDIMMPGGSGIHCLDTLRTMRVKAPVIVLSALDEAGACAEAFKKGVVDYVTKPFDSGNLFERVDRIFQKREKKGRHLT